MAREIEHVGDTGSVYYAKPTPITANPTWADDVETLSETVAGYFYADIASPADNYVIFEQAGGSPNQNDSAVATVSQAGDSGAGPHEITVSVDDGTDPIEGVNVRYKSGTDVLTGTTDVNGECTLNCDAKTYTVTLHLNGYSFAGDTHEVIADESVTYSMTETSGSAADPNFSTGTLTVIGTDGLPVADAEVFVSIKSVPSGIADGFRFPSERTQLIANGSGVIQFDFVRQATYKVELSAKRSVEIVVPDASSFDVDTHVGETE
jgi:hypothetical protein